MSSGLVRKIFIALCAVLEDVETCPALSAIKQTLGVRTYKASLEAFVSVGVLVSR